MSAQGIKDGLTALERFKAHKDRVSAHHPLYATSASEYGHIPRGVKLEVVPPKHGKGAAGSFSDTFRSGPYRDTGLNTTVSRHRFMKDLDGTVI